MTDKSDMVLQSAFDPETQSIIERACVLFAFYSAQTPEFANRQFDSVEKAFEAGLEFGVLRAAWLYNHVIIKDGEINTKGLEELKSILEKNP